MNSGDWFINLIQDINSISTVAYVSNGSHVGKPDLAFEPRFKVQKRLWTAAPVVSAAPKPPKVTKCLKKDKKTFKNNKNNSTASSFKVASEVPRYGLGSPKVRARHPDVLALSSNFQGT